MLPIMSSGDDIVVESPNPSQPARNDRGLSPQPESDPGPAHTQRIELAATPVQRVQRRPGADQEPIPSQSAQKTDQPGYGGPASHGRQNFEPRITSWLSLDTSRGTNHPLETASAVEEPVSMYKSGGPAAGPHEVEIPPDGVLSTGTVSARPFERYSCTKLIF